MGNEKCVGRKKDWYLSIIFLFLVIFLVTCGPPRNINDQLIIAARKNDITKVRELIKKGANINATEKVIGEGQTALFHAASYGHTEIVKLLIQSGADVNARPSGRSTALMMAAWAGYTNTVRVLLNAGADVNSKDEKGDTALTEAVRKNHLEAARLLIERGANVNTRSVDSNTPLSWARANNNSELISLLKKAGATN